MKSVSAPAVPRTIKVLSAGALTAAIGFASLGQPAASAGRTSDIATMAPRAVAAATADSQIDLTAAYKPADSYSCNTAQVVQWILNLGAAYIEDQVAAAGGAGPVTILYFTLDAQYWLDIAQTMQAGADISGLVSQYICGGN
jgi:hypothetical protein